MKNRMMAGLAVAAVSTTLVVVGAASANAADECTPSAGSPAQIGAWSWTAFTDWSPSQATPADPDGQSGENNVLNLVQVGEGFGDTADAAYQQKVSDGWQRFTPWQPSDTAPSVGPNEEAGHRYEQSVGNGDGTEGIASVWSVFSPNKEQGPFDGPPSYPGDPRGTWHDKGTLPPGQAGPDGVYQNGQGNGDWFYRSHGTPGQPETSHTEYSWDVYAFHYEYRWSVYTRTVTPATDPVTCETDPTEPVEAIDPTEPAEPTTPIVPAEQLAVGVQAQTATQHAARASGPVTRHNDRPAVRPSVRQQLAPTAVPTVIDAGL